MYRVERQFQVPTGHRLSKHAGRCKNIHGHNLTILVGVKSKLLNKNDMVIDFSDLKALVNESIDVWDHCLLLNESDIDLIEVCSEMRHRTFPFDPTAERLAEVVFNTVNDKLPDGVMMDYVTIYENERSKATFSLDE